MPTQRTPSYSMGSSVRIHISGQSHAYSPSHLAKSGQSQDTMRPDNPGDMPILVSRSP
ncbi:MAG: hypothetical protein H6815_10595 [Phycisphaeraceae bacterium]|nr:hypothetical protein [Phycisphaerales bacterium]MCB9860885.1 hypothetical protein [Phycisphaeraceae bacterium]